MINLTFTVRRACKLVKFHNVSQSKIKINFFENFLIQNFRDIHFRNFVVETSPDLSFKTEAENSRGEKEEVAVSMTADFFWPNS